MCGGHWTSLRGELSSPRYPEPYPARRLCNYTIELPPGNLVQLDWQHMDIENDGHCAYDYVEVSQKRTAQNAVETTCSSHQSHAYFLPRDQMMRGRRLIANA